MRRVLTVAFLLALLPLSACKNEGSSTKTNPTNTLPTAEDESQDSEAHWKELESATIIPNDYNIDPFPTLEIADLSKGHMKANSDNPSDLPASLQGIWWMKGNQLAPGNLTTFANAPKIKNGDADTYLIQEYAPGGYTFDGTDAGRKSFSSSCTSNVNFEVTFKPDYSFAQLVQVMQIPPFGRVKLPKYLVNYTMEPAGDGNWLRRSKWGPIKLPDYSLLRIIDGNGNKTAAFAEFQAYIQANGPQTSFVPHKG